MKCWKVIVQYAGVIAAFLITCALSVYEWVRKKLTMKTILRHRKVIALCVSVIVALSTTYALILPAITVSVEEAREMGGIDVGPAEEEAVAAAKDAAEEQPDAILTDETTEEAIETAEQEEEIAEETADAGEAVDVLSEEEQQEVPAEDAVQTEEAVAAEEIIPLTGSVYAHSLNIRAEKSLEADIVGTLEDTEIITILEDTEEAVDEDGQTVEDGWLRIQKNDGTEGYVKDEYIILENETVEEKRPAAAFAETVGAVSVSVEAPVGAFPAGTMMTVTPVAQEDIMDAVQSVVEENIKTVSAVDITFTDPLGDEIEPYGEIKVSMSSTEIVETEEPVVVHVDDEGTAAVVESQKEEEQVVFAADSFSVYVIVGTESITTEYISASGDTYEITVSYDAEANIPEDAELEVSEVSRATKNENGEYYADLAEDLLNVDRANDEGIILFDISIVKDGEKVQPEAPVNVEVKLNDRELIGTDGVVHFGETKTEVLEATEEDEAVSFETSSFSIYAFKDIDPNDDGTYDLTLSVAGSSSSVTTYTDVNVIFVLDTSNSMLWRATSEYGSMGTSSDMTGNGQNGSYFQLYKQSGSSYVAITDEEEYDGTVYYYSERNRRYYEYEGKRVNGGTPESSYTRIAQANVALSSVMNALAQKNQGENKDAVEMLLITFNSSADPSNAAASAWSTTAPTLSNDTNRGTAWASALTAAENAARNKATAETAAKGSADDTYIIFITDGKASDSGYENIATRLNSNYAGLYLVFAYGTDGGASDLQELSNSGFYDASSTEALVSAMTSILGQINNSSSYEQVVYNDGVTSMTSSLVAKDVSNVTYKKYPIVYQKDGKYYYEDTSLGEDEVPSANVATSENSSATLYYDKTKGEAYTGAGTTYENNVLSWDLSNVRLENGWLYTTTFTVWPSQAAYDLVADLNNGNRQWSDLTDAEKASIEGTPVYDEDGETIISYTKPYSLKTNTDDTKINYNQIDAQTTKGKFPDKVQQTASGYSYDGTAMRKVSDTEYTVKIGDTTYTLTIDIGPEGTTYTLKASTPGTTPVENPDPVALEDGQMLVKKEWDDSINDRNESNGVIFYLWEDGVKIKTKNGADNLQLPIGSGSSAVWADTIDVAPGLMTVKNGTIDVKELGHNYTLTEEIPGDITGDYNDYSYEFSAQTVRPMEVNGELQYLILVQEPYYPAPSGATTYTIPTLTDDKGHTVTGGTYYVATGTEDATLKGENHKTSELDITKEIDATLSDKTKDELDTETFTYTVTLTSPSGSKDNGVKLWIYTPDEGGYALPEYNNEKYSGTSTAVTFTDNTATVTVTINRTQIARFTNLPSGTTYTITETQANGKTLAEEGYVISGIGQGTSARPAPASTSSATCNGEIAKTNTRYYNNYQNKLTSVDAELKVQKVLSGYEWSAGPESYEFTITAEDGAPMPENTTVTVTSESVDLTETFGEAKYTEPGTYSYTITETNAGQVVDGIEYGTAATIIVTVERNNDGTLSVKNISQNYVAATDSAPASGKVQITNTWSVTEAYATKVWENADGTDTAPEGATVVFTLYADGEATEYTVTLDGEVDDTPTGTASAGYESEVWKAQFVNLPKYSQTTKEEIVYTIAETQGYTGYKVSTTDPVASGQTITNSQLSAEIKLLKIGDGQTSTILDGAEFELYSTWNGADATDNVKAKNINGQEIGKITTTNGLATIGKLLPETYYLVETKAPDGYNMLADSVEIYIQLVDQDPGYTVSYKQKDYGASSAAGNLSPDTDGAYLITVSDPSGAELPMTGGPGTLLYTLGGIALIMASALMYGFRMRCRERRLN